MRAFVFIKIRSATLIGLALSLLFAPVNNEAKPLYASSLKQGMDFLSQSKPDSAIAQFVKAYSNGLSRDSLFYFWSEALLQKGVLDSALAAHYMASSDHDGRFRIALLKQRSEIYDKLGWHQDAAKVLDTIHSLPEYRSALFIPDFEIGLSAGFNKEGQISDSSSPWGTNSGDSLHSLDNGFQGTVDFRSTWGMIHGPRSFSFGIAGMASMRTYNLSTQLQSGDSMELDGSLFASLSDKRFSSTYRLSLNRRIDDSLFIGNSIEGGIIGSGEWSPMLWMGGFANVNTAGKFANSRAWLFVSAMQIFNSKLSANYHCFFNVSFDNRTDFGFPLDTMHVLYAEDARRQYPVFYTDASYTSVIDTSAIRVITGALRNDIIASAHDTLINVNLRQPNSNIIVNPKATLSVKGIIPIRIGLSWKLNYFWEPYVWDQINLSNHYFVYSRSDSRYYLVPADPLMNELTITRGLDGGLAIAPAAQPGDAVIHHSMIRVDNAAIAEVSLQLYDGKTGAVSLRTLFSKNWSTLAGKAPISIPEWSIFAVLEWRLKLLNSIKRI